MHMDVYYIRVHFKHLILLLCLAHAALFLRMPQFFVVVETWAFEREREKKKKISSSPYMLVLCREILH